MAIIFNIDVLNRSNSKIDLFMITGCLEVNCEVEKLKS